MTDSSAPSPITASTLRWTHTPRQSGRACVGSADGSDVEIYFELHGPEAAPLRVLLVSGHASSSRAWVTSLNYFRHDGRFQVCVFDNRGVGDSTQDCPEFTIQDMARDALALLDHIGWTSSVKIVGVSLGRSLLTERSTYP
ncbi:hypothetical protein HK405_009232, partial [Cladochytrium tenue]